jgi:hypothetical protein
MLDCGLKYLPLGVSGRAVPWLRPFFLSNISPARIKPSGAVGLGGGAETRGKVHWCFTSSPRAVHNAGMPPAYDFKLALTRVIEPTGGVELATLEDAARFVALLRPFRQARPHWDFAAELLLKAAETGEESDIEMATAQMERGLRVEGWL